LTLARCFSLVLFPGLALAATTVLYEPLSPETGPFPSDVLTTFDVLQRTGLRLNLPVPDCATRYTECQETAVLDQTDGFSLRPRIRVRFSGPVNTSTLRDGVYLAPLDSSNTVIPIDQVVWDPATNTMFAKPGAVLRQETRYALVVTDAIRDTAGEPVIADPSYRRCVQASDPLCPAPSRAVAGTIFTTMSATAWLEHARDILPYVPPATRMAEPRGGFRIADLTGLVLHHQNGVNPLRFADLSLPVESGLLAGIDRLVIGSFRSPRFLEDDQSIRPAPTLPGFAVPESTIEVGFNAFLPESPKPPAGYPVVIFGHGFGDSRFGAPTAVAPTLARAGLATIAITAVGHGFGPFSTVTFTTRDGRSTTLPTLGRSVDLNNDGVIETNEGSTLITPVAYGARDCFRQTAVDLMQLTRAIRQGLDLDGDGVPDVDPNRIYYGGHSLGAMFGPVFAAMEPAVRAIALNVGGGSAVEIARISPAYRDIDNDTLRLNIPSLLNRGDTFDEDYPLPNLPVRIVTTPGALAIQAKFERADWLGIPGDPLTFASRLLPRPVLAQIARGDRTMPNPASSALVRAGGFQATTWLYRHDLARSRAPDLPLDPHPFLVLFVTLGGGTIQLPSVAGLAISIDGQQQFAGFFASDGASIPDPNNFSRLLLGLPAFELASTLPFDLGY
jgi:hypothetical protein